MSCDFLLGVSGLRARARQLPRPSLLWNHEPGPSNKLCPLNSSAGSLPLDHWPNEPRRRRRRRRTGKWSGRRAARLGPHARKHNTSAGEQIGAPINVNSAGHFRGSLLLLSLASDFYRPARRGAAPAGLPAGWASERSRPVAQLSHESRAPRRASRESVSSCTCIRFHELTAPSAIAPPLATFRPGPARASRAGPLAPSQRSASSTPADRSSGRRNGMAARRLARDCARPPTAGSP